MKITIKKTEQDDVKPISQKAIDRVTAALKVMSDDENPYKYAIGDMPKDPSALVAPDQTK